VVILRIAGPEEAKNLGGAKGFRLIRIRRSDAQSAENYAGWSRQFATNADRHFHLHKRGQQFIRSHDETLSVVTMCVCNPDRSPIGIHG
jgi:hypothetical protein